jgi:uncharacterized membrane protein YeaQ/YmgE (transglycosylase-associated protein family)
MIFLFILVLGLAAGWAASYLLNRQLTGGATLLLGIAGSLLGGGLASLIWADDFDIHLSGVIGSIVGATILLAIGGLIFGRKRG